LETFSLEAEFAEGDVLKDRHRKNGVGLREHHAGSGAQQIEDELGLEDVVWRASMTVAACP